MASRITFTDLAKAADVSTTSVYKAIHGKSGISEETRGLILDIAKKNGFKINKVAQSLRRKPIKIGVVIEFFAPEYTGDVLRGIKDTFRELSDHKVEAVYGSIENSLGKDRVLKDVKDMIESNIDGLILCPGLPYSEYQSLADEMDRKNIPLVFVTDDVPNCKKLATVRNNAKIVGGLGAAILNMINENGNNALFIGNKDVVCHKEVIEGFTNVLNTNGRAPIAIYETQDDDLMAYYATEKLLKDYPFVNGIFVGTTHSMGVCKKIIEKCMIDEISIVCVDTYPQIIEYMQNNTIKATIFQNPYSQGRLAVRKMYEFLTVNSVPDDMILINPRAVFKENCLNYLD